MVKKYSDLCMELRRTLAKNGDLQPALTARELVAAASEKTMEQLLRDMQLYATDEAIRRLRDLESRYLQGEPLAYLLGRWSFYGLPMVVAPEVLIPRDDTMVVTALALEAIKETENPRVLDLCTGSGCIGVAIAHFRPDARVTMADISLAALQVAKDNAALNNVSKRVNLLQVDACQPAPAFLGEFDVIVSNPPYITGAEMLELDTSVKDYEPHLALFGGDDGLDFYRHICRNFRPCLKEDGCLCFEFGMGQETAVGDILKENNFEDLTFCRDTSNIMRAVMARKNGKE